MINKIVCRISLSLAFLVALPASSCMSQSGETSQIRERQRGHQKSEYRLKLEFDRLFSEKKYENALDIAKLRAEIAKQHYGNQHDHYLMALQNIAAVHLHLFNYVEAAEIENQRLAIAERRFGVESYELIPYLDNLAKIYSVLSKNDYWEHVLRRKINILEKDFSPENVVLVHDLDWLSIVLKRRGNYDSAEQIAARSLRILESNYGFNDPRIAIPMMNLALIYIDKGGNTEHAGQLLIRCISLFENDNTDGHELRLASGLSNLMSYYNDIGRFDDASIIFKRAKAIYDTKFGTDTPHAVALQLNYATALAKQGKVTEAEAIASAATAVARRFSRNSPLGAGFEASKPLTNILIKSKKYDEAKLLLQDNLDIINTTLGEGHYQSIPILDLLAFVHFFESDWNKSYQYAHSSTRISIDMTRRGGGSLLDQPASSGYTYAERAQNSFELLIKSGYRKAQEGGFSPEILDQAFIAAQWPLVSEAAKAINLLSAREAGKDPQARTWARERQDRLYAWRRLNEMLAQARANPDSSREAMLLAQRRLDDEGKEIARLNQNLQIQYADYEQLINPLPLGIAEVQRNLGGDEALIFFYNTHNWGHEPDETFIWFVTNDGAEWFQSNIGPQEIKDHVSALRCGLDQSIWFSNPPNVSDIRKCMDLLKIENAPIKNGYLPFDFGRAHILYNALFNKIEVKIRQKKKLLIVPSGPLTALPFSALVVQPADNTLTGGDYYRNTKWLGFEHAIAILPAVTSLQALRSRLEPTKAADSFIGFGNPSLSGPLTSSRKVGKSSCRVSETPPATIDVQKTSVIAPPSKPLADVLSLKPLADVSAIARLRPLKETVEELCSIARMLGVEESELDSRVYLGSRATESNVALLNFHNKLSTYQVVHFATHGLIGGQVKSVAEAALVLTPPSVATEKDDGVLTASEIAELRLDADWVVLSACNTAGGNTADSWPLSGLARAFFYARARALLLSQWAVDSTAAERLTTATFAALKRDPAAGRSWALRNAMAALFESGNERDVHPAIWAPFVVVGETKAIH